jgi:tol-pal system protein YbgF
VFARTALATALILWVGGAFGAPPQEDLDTRVTRLERLMESQTLVEMLTRIESLQQEVQQLRGMAEAQGHAIDALQRRQRDLYLDMDRRLSRLEQAAGSASVAATPADPETGGTEEQTAYQQALDLLHGLHYEEATRAFGEYLLRYPQGRYAHVAQYWIGEASYAQRDFNSAIAAYQQLVDAHAQSPKVPEALLKIGASRQELGETDAAIKVLTDLIARYPGTTEAGQARALLQQITPAQ